MGREPGGSHRALEFGGGALAGSGCQSPCARRRQARSQIRTSPSDRHSARRTEGAGLALRPHGKPRAPARCPACLSPLRLEGESHIHPVPSARGSARHAARAADGTVPGTARAHAPRARLSALSFRQRASPSDPPLTAAADTGERGSDSECLSSGLRVGPAMPGARPPRLALLLPRARRHGRALLSWVST